MRIGVCLRTVIAFLVMGGGFVARSPAGETARDLIRSGNEHFAAGRFQEALDAYKQASPEPGVSEELILNNRAAAQYKLGQFDEARDLWGRIASRRDAAFESRVRYNLGNCSYSDALAKSEKGDVKGAIDGLEHATEQYRDAVRLNPELPDARANLELAQQLKTKLEEIQTQQQQQQQGQQDKKGDQDKDQKQKQDKKGDQGQDSKDKSQDQQKSDQQKSQQGDQGDEDQQKKQQQQSGKQGKQGEAKDQKQGDGEEQGEAQTESQDEDGTPDPSKNPKVKLTKEQVEKLMQLVRDMEKQRRKAIMQKQTVKERPVEKDW